MFDKDTPGQIILSNGSMFSVDNVRTVQEAVNANAAYVTIRDGNGLKRVIRTNSIISFSE